MPIAGDIIRLHTESYTLRAVLGSSAYGVVWRASAHQSGQEAALKFINQQSMSQALPELQERWISSANKECAFLQALAPWDERHIVRLLDQGRHDNLPVLAMELMAGDLQAHIAHIKKLSFAQVLNWLGQINHALAKVHQYGWRYLDLKPANLLLCKDLTTLKLADFGANRLLAESHAHSYAGTASWQAPEQFFPAGEDENGLHYATDARADYFALGALFYFLVTGGMPLRFCSLCGQAYREHQVWGAQALAKRHGGVPPTLYPDEKTLFVGMIDAKSQTQERAAAQVRDGTWSPDGGQADEAPSPAARAALGLLQSLLAFAPEERPRHDVEISRSIGAIEGALGLGGLVRHR